MANSEGFWSYVHADDEAEGGRILRLARDVAGQFEMLTGEPLTLFLDKDAIKWSDNPSKRASLIASECAQDGVVVLFVYLFQLFPNLARNASAVLPDELFPVRSCLPRPSLPQQFSAQFLADIEISGAPSVYFIFTNEAARPCNARAKLTMLSSGSGCLKVPLIPVVAFEVKKHAASYRRSRTSRSHTNSYRFA